MNKKILLLLLLFTPLMAMAEQDDTADQLAKLNFINGPATGYIGTKASIKIPQGYVFLNDKDTRRFIEINGNPPENNDYLIAPKELNWFAIFRYEDTGYIKDDEKIDPDELLKQIKASDTPQNEERKKLGLQPLYTEGWDVPPHYDVQTKRLEWGIRLRDDKGEVGVNYTSRLLGRNGVMSAILVANPNTLNQDIRDFKSVLNNYSFNSGDTYADFRPGDHVAEIGLAALILGGAAAVATKKGFWAVIVGFLAAFWKIVIGIIVAATAAIGRLFKKKN